MSRLVYAAAAGAFLLAGCAERLVELPINREPAVVVELAGGPIRCPANTVTYLDEDPESGAGAVPADFDGRTVLFCHVDYTGGQRRAAIDRFPVRQWQVPLTPALRAAFDLPDRELRPRVACAASTGGISVVYLADTRRRAVRVLLPYEDPCHRIREDVVALLPGLDQPADLTFTADQKAR